MDTLFGYGSDSGGEEPDKSEEVMEQKPAGAASSKGLLGMLPPAKGSDDPAAKRQRRTLDIGKMIASRPQGSDSDDEPAPAAMSKGVGLLSFVSTLGELERGANEELDLAAHSSSSHRLFKPCENNDICIPCVQLPAPKRETTSTAYEDALARKEKDNPSSDGGQKKMSKAAMNAALFEKQRQEKAAARAAAASDAAAAAGGTHAESDENGAHAQQVRQPSICMCTSSFFSCVLPNVLSLCVYIWCSL